MPSPADVERAKLLHESGRTTPSIAKEFGVCSRTINRWYNIEDSPEFSEQLEQIRSENRDKFVNDAWKNIHELNRLMAERIAEGGKAFKSPKDIAVCMGVSFDKVVALERPEAKGGSGGGVVININPPAQLDGTPTRIMADSVQVHDVEGEIHSDNLGGGSGEDVLRLPERCQDGPGVPGESRGDSSIDIQEPD